MSQHFSFLNHDIFEDIEEKSIDPWISSDYHFFKELRKDLTDENMKKMRRKDTSEVFNLHNQKVKKDDVVLLLGDMTEEEFSQPEYSSLTEIIKTKIKALNGQKYLLKGNNDKFDDKFYRDCGFIRVYNESYIETSDYIFSHIPVKTPKDVTKLNIHGHIHGSHEYWGLDWHNKIDVYWRLYEGPIKLSKLIELSKSYKAKTVKGPWDSFVEY